MKKLTFLFTILLTFCAAGCARFTPVAQPNSNPTTAPTVTQGTIPTIAPTTTPTTAPTTPTIDLSIINIDVDKILVVDSVGEEITAEVAEKERVFLLNGVALNLTYKTAIYYPMGDRIGYLYIVNGDESKTILLDDQGNLMMILYPYIKLNISSDSTPQEVLELLKPELSKIIDLTPYNHISIPEYSFSASVRAYYYTFTHFVDGFVTGYFTVTVEDNGAVRALKISKLSTINFENFQLNINKAKLEAALVLKLKDIYDTEITQYVSHTAMEPQIVQHKKQLYVRYDASTIYRHSKEGSGTLHSFIESYLIPLDAVSSAGQ